MIDETMVIKIIVLIVLYLGNYIIFGVLVSKQDESYSISNIIVKGFFLYYFLFMCIETIAKYLNYSLGLLQNIWLVIIILLWTVVILFMKPKEIIKINKASAFLSMICLLQIIVIILNSINTAVFDSTFIISDITTSIQTNRINRVLGLSGVDELGFISARLLYCYDMHSAVFCKMVSIHPLIEANYVQTVVLSVVVICIVKSIFNELFFEIELRVLGLLLWIWCSFWGLGQSNGAEYFYFRTYEGKSILVNLILPTMFFAFLKIYKDFEKKDNWFFLFITILASYGLCASSIVIVPVMVFSYSFVLWVLNRNKTVLLRSLFCLLPCVIMIIWYISVAGFNY